MIHKCNSSHRQQWWRLKEHLKKKKSHSNEIPSCNESFHNFWTDKTHKRHQVWCRVTTDSKKSNICRQETSVKGANTELIILKRKECVHSVLWRAPVYSNTSSAVLRLGSIPNVCYLTKWNALVLQHKQHFTVNARERTAQMRLCAQADHLWSHFINTFTDKAWMSGLSVFEQTLMCILTNHFVPRSLKPAKMTKKWSVDLYHYFRMNKNAGTVH